MLSRREFVKRCPSLAVAAGLASQISPLGILNSGDAQESKPQEKKDQPKKKPPIVDTHLHCFAGERDSQFPYHANAPYRPESAATPQHLLKCMEEADVNFAVVVHPEPYQDDHRYLEYCLKQGGGKLKGTCLFLCDRPGSVDNLKPLVKRTGEQIVAARLHAYAPGRLPPFKRPELIRELWKAASDVGLAMQLHFEPRYAPQLEPFIKEFPETTVVIDHLGRPFQGTVDEHETVVQWSRFDNTIMKVSSLPRQDQYPHRDIGPVIKRLVDAYGPERMIYGGGFGSDATGASYQAYRRRVRGFIDFLPANDQAQILGGTAARVFGFV